MAGQDRWRVRRLGIGRRAGAVAHLLQHVASGLRRARAGASLRRLAVAALCFAAGAWFGAGRPWIATRAPAPVHESADPGPIGDSVETARPPAGPPSPMVTESTWAADPVSETQAVPPGPQEPALPVLDTGALIWPVEGEVLQEFGWYRHPSFGDWRFHGGLLMAAHPDGAPVRAVFDGEVESVDATEGGWHLTLRHGGGWTSEYAGLRTVAVDVGERVGAGGVLGTAGSSPGSPGIVFRLRRNGEAVDPLVYLPLEGMPVPVGARCRVALTLAHTSSRATPP